MRRGDDAQKGVLQGAALGLPYTGSLALGIIRDSHSERAVEQALHFGSRLIGASSACLVWLEDDYEFSIADEYNMPVDFLARYPKELRKVDPMNTLAQSMRRARMEMLYHDSVRTSQSWNEYVGGIYEYGFGDEVDMLLWSSDRPIAGLALFRPPQSPSFASESLDWEVIHGQLEHTIQMHWRVRDERVRRILRSRCGLQPREIELAQILVQGASNADISQIMNISISTVKTHVVNILNKIGLHSRAEISAYINYIQFE